MLFSNGAFLSTFLKFAYLVRGANISFKGAFVTKNIQIHGQFLVIWLFVSMHFMKCIIILSLACINMDNTLHAPNYT